MKLVEEFELEARFADYDEAAVTYTKEVETWQDEADHCQMQYQEALGRLNANKGYQRLATLLAEAPQGRYVIEIAPSEQWDNATKSHVLKWHNAEDNALAWALTDMARAIDKAIMDADEKGKKKRVFSAEHCRNLSEALKGRCLSPLTRQKISAAQKGLRCKARIPASEIAFRLEQLQASGLSRRDYCREHGLNYKTVSGWIRRSKQKGQGQS